MANIRVFDFNGVEIAEIPNVNVSRSWKLNAAGQAEFTLPITSPKAREPVLRYGNLVLIEDDRLPSWSGVIDLPREWPVRAVTVRAYSGEWLLSYRRGDNVKRTGTAGEIFKEIIAYCNLAEYLGVEIGSVWGGGMSREETLNPQNSRGVYDDVLQIAERADNDFWFEAVLDKGKLGFRANWVQRRGRVLNMTLEEGAHLKLSDRPMVEQGQIINDLLGIGEGSSTASKVTARRVDDESRARYRLRQGSVYFSGNTQVGTVENNTESALKQCREPMRVFDVGLLNRGGLWKKVWVGDQVEIRFNTVGFTGSNFGCTTPVRILGMETDGNADLRCVCGEVRE